MSDQIVEGGGSTQRLLARIAGVAAAATVGIGALFGMPGSSVDHSTKPVAASKGSMAPSGLRPDVVPVLPTPDHKEELSGGEYARMAFMALAEQDYSGGTKSFAELLTEQGLKMQFIPLEETFSLKKLKHPDKPITEFPVPQKPIDVSPDGLADLPTTRSGEKRVYALVKVGDEVFMLVSPDIEKLDNPDQVDAPNKRGNELVMSRYVLLEEGSYDIPDDVKKLIVNMTAPPYEKAPGNF